MLLMTAVLLAAFVGSAIGNDPEPKATSAADLKALEGTWEVVTHEVNGKKAKDGGYYSPKKIVISVGKLGLYEQGKPDLPIQVDPKKAPKAIDVYYPGAMKAKAHKKGIYALDKDQLKICLPLSLAESARPTKFSSEDGHALYVLRRLK